MCILPQYKYWGKIVNWFFNNYGKILTIVFKDFHLHHLSFLFCLTHHSLLFLFGLTSGPLDAKCSYSELLKCGHIYLQAFYTVRAFHLPSSNIPACSGLFWSEPQSPHLSKEEDGLALWHEEISVWQNSTRNHAWLEPRSSTHSSCCLDPSYVALAGRISDSIFAFLTCFPHSSVCGEFRYSCQRV